MQAGVSYHPGHPWAAALLAGSLAAVACTGGERQVPRVSMDTLESGAILVRNGAVGVWSAGEAWRAVEEVRIGSADAAAPAVLFGDVWDVTLDALGRIYVLDRQPKEIRVFDQRGDHVRTVGREGGGPGEFKNPIRLAWGPDRNLWVLDQGNGRYSVFDTAGNYLDSHARRKGGWGYAWEWGFDRAGHLYEPDWVRDPATGDSRRAYVRHTLAEEVVAADTFDLPRSRPSSYRIEYADGATVVGIPFAPRLIWRFDGRDGLWFSVSDSYRIYHRSLAGDTIRIVEREYEPVPVSEADLSGVRENFGRYGEAHVNEIIARMPEVKPAFETFVLDDQEYLWVVQRSATERDRSTRGASPSMSSTPRADTWGLLK